MDVSATFVAHPQPAELVQPSQSSLDYPAVHPQPAAVGGAPSGQRRRDVALSQRLAMLPRVIGPVGVQPLGPATGATAAAPHRRHGVHQRQQLGYVVAIGAGQEGRQRGAVGVSERVMLASRLAAVRGIGAGFFPRPPTARTDALSTQARDQSSWSASCNLDNSVSWSFSHTPAACQSRSRRQQVIPEPQPISWGSISHGMPLFSTNRMPVRALRSSRGLRPGWRNRRGLAGGSSGSTISHSSSLTKGFAMGYSLPLP